jgi:hypothetical protein
MKKLIFLILPLIMISCGTQKSLTETEYVTYGVVEVSNDLTVTGKLVYVDDTVIEISVDGALKSYNKSEIISFEKVRRPDTDAMLKDIVKNTSSTAGNTGFFVALTVISIAAVIILNFATP